MDLVLRGLAVYVFLFLIMRIAGKRSMAELTPFNFILLLIVSEATQQALLGNDFSITTALIIITTLVGMEILLSLLKQHIPRFGLFVEGTPLVVLDHGQPLKKRMDMSHIDEADILEAARRTQGLERLEQVKYAVLEKSGGISIIPNGKGG